MQEFIVTLKNGRRLAIRAERCVTSDSAVELVVDVPDDAPMFSSRPPIERVAFFDRDQVVAVIATDQLISEDFEPTGGEIGFPDAEVQGEPDPEETGSIA